jgi:hypothetical protein
MLAKKSTQQIHYSASLKMTVFKSNGDGACGEIGIISPYPGVVTCETCKRLIDQEDSALQFHQAVTLSRH